MAKRRITVTVDEDLIDMIGLLGDDNLSATVNEALRGRLEALARRQALRELLDQWEAERGPIDPDVLAEADRAFDEAGGLVDSQVV